MRTRPSRISKDESGATAIEYGLIAALVSIMVISGAALIGDDLNSIFRRVAAGISSSESTTETTGETGGNRD